MLDAISDPSLSTKVTLGLLVLFTGFYFYSQQNRKSLLVFVAFLLGLILVMMIDYLVESPREFGVQQLKQAAEVTATGQMGNLNSILSESFQFGGFKKKEFIQKLSTLKKVWNEWQGAEIWSFDRGDYHKIDDNHMTIGFLGQAKGFPVTMRYIKADFVREEKTWRIVTFHFYDPLQREKGGEQSVPEFGRN